MARYRAVLFDWRGTLVQNPDAEWCITRALRSLDRSIEPRAVEAAVQGLATAGELPEILETERHEDCSAELARSVTMRRFELAGLDDELANALYRIDAEPTTHPLYPDVPEVLSAIRDRGSRLVLVSDIHHDIRVDLAGYGIGHLIDACVLWFEHGFQKPDVRMFALALEAAEAEPGDALMVGDRASHDGGAAEAGITTLILPPPMDAGPRGLDIVLRLLR
ncbi:MAG TPA: hypothetical protein DIT48_07535 [Actinobacteria bacterium]|nr:hypothetical protein [Actinomycetota bacterium]